MVVLIEIKHAVSQRRLHRPLCLGDVRIGQVAATLRSRWLYSVKVRTTVSGHAKRHPRFQGVDLPVPPASVAFRGKSPASLKMLFATAFWGEWRPGGDSRNAKSRPEGRLFELTPINQYLVLVAGIGFEPMTFR